MWAPFFIGGKNGKNPHLDRAAGWLFMKSNMGLIMNIVRLLAIAQTVGRARGQAAQAAQPIH